MLCNILGLKVIRVTSAHNQNWIPDETNTFLEVDQISSKTIAILGETQRKKLTTFYGN